LGGRIRPSVTDRNPHHGTGAARTASEYVAQVTVGHARLDIALGRCYRDGVPKENALIRAVVAGDVVAVTAAIAAGDNINTEEGTALRIAATRGHVEVVHALLAAGADIHAAYDAALRTAATSGHADVAHALLVAGADVHVKDNDSMQWSTLCWATVRGRIEVIRLLLAAGADIHFNGDEALRRAAIYSHPAAVRLLLANGADPLVAWLTGDRSEQHDMIEALEACADDLTPAQRVALTKESDLFVHMRATLTSSEQQHRLQR